MMYCPRNHMYTQNQHTHLEFSNFPIYPQHHEIYFRRNDILLIYFCIFPSSFKMCPYSKTITRKLYLKSSGW